MNIEEIGKELRKAFERVLDFCDTLEKSGYSTKNYLPDSSTREVCILSVKLFCIYLASADNSFDNSEVNAINVLMDSKESKEKLKQLAVKSQAIEDEFGDQVPLVLNCMIDFDNRSGRDESSCRLLYQIYSLIGAYILVSDDTVNEKEYYRFLRFMKTMYRKITNDLNKDLKDLLPPASCIRSVLSEYDVTSEQIAAMDRSSRKKNFSQKKDGKEEKNNRSAKKEESDEEQEETLEELLNQLNELIGLHEVKYEVTSLINLCRVKQIREANGLMFPPLSLHMVFSGNPGTGKTTVARLLAKIYKKIGVLSKGHLVEVDRAGLVGGYVGQTALKVQDVINSAIGGILFIDEAYSLTYSSADSDYGREAVDTLVKAMEDHRDDLIVIVAGYPEPMKKFVSSNPGLRSRFNKYILFRDYLPEELVQVFTLFCRQSGYRASLDALDYVKNYYEEYCANKPENFANAREVRNLFEQSMMRQANRIVLVSDVKPETLTLLKKEDVSGVMEAVGKSEQLAQLALRGMPMDVRMGIPGELMICPLDELELTARAISVLENNNIKILGQVIEHLESGKKLSELNGMNEYLAGSIFKKLLTYGYDGDTEGLEDEE